jgi:hypothetical protein
MMSCCRVNHSAIKAGINWPENVVHVEQWETAKDGAFVDCDS